MISSAIVSAYDRLIVDSMRAPPRLPCRSQGRAWPCFTTKGSGASCDRSGVVHAINLTESFIQLHSNCGSYQGS